MTDILGPASTAGAVTTRPAEDRSFSSLDSWFKDCSSPTLQDGTELAASIFNGLLDVLRQAIRGNGLLLDGVTKVIPEIGSDGALLLKAIQQLVQRGQSTYVVDTGAENALVVSLTPAVLEYKAGLTIRVKAANAVTGATTINVNGLGAIAIKKVDGTALSADDIKAGGIAILSFDGTFFQLLASHTDLSGGGGGAAAFVLPLTDAAGTATVITADYTPDVGTPTKGQLIGVRLTAAIAGATTINPDGLGAVAIVDAAGVALVSGFAASGEILVLLYDASGKYRVINKAVQSQGWVAWPGIGSYNCVMMDTWPTTPYSAMTVGTTGSLTGLPGTWKVINSLTFADTSTDTGSGGVNYNFQPFRFLQRIA